MQRCQPHGSESTLRALRGVSFLALLGLLAGCANFTESIRPDDKYDGKSAYIYGRFHLDSRRHQLSNHSIGFEVHCRDGKKYTIGFSTDQPLQVIQVAPSKCQLEEILYTSGGEVAFRGMPSFRLLRNEFLDPGGIYYVGDFVAASRSESRFKFFYTEFRTGWAFGKVEGRYERTTAEMKRAFPGLAAAPTEDRMTR
jgi:hypothetical protein